MIYFILLNTELPEITVHNITKNNCLYSMFKKWSQQSPSKDEVREHNKTKSDRRYNIHKE